MLGRSSPLSLLSLSYILARSARPDSTLSTGSSVSGHPSKSIHPLPTTAGAFVGVDGKLRKPDLSPTPGDTKPPHELGIEFTLLICNFFTDASSSFTLDPIGETGGDSAGGDIGGEISVDVGEDDTRPFEK
ncbi:hypothetical protein IEQ34_002998 [Dendrobium chrysotoxum]|uniref:Secreted protein n=1 Tax=Dendrobium chrysotoxum TaxID=161865 RepID=A0AAV7HIK2_DENCH|nr:hypothetical protein IEQ34_002998 [Dendrobium chrysotoxum]